ncbi:MAG: cytochrome d ubiquinol oxidase subunit II [Gammaproteobacteria bacterium CG11_big_fil_rev_8_21_14_0_20_46_22]|nr:MAG: cytochrome d ubiquinol oxidase subunit II [Gammaproteobacteria bacterium CG12_big_fil_rev_8_21_14_0_65_46_12]PIR11267.1 MAG: cytochrome d ubiquinol oxidase subunit II [Gammaproteobacteria bacterium CG11_big_fil_rev_8_21_14_0_20_46_22]
MFSMEGLQLAWWFIIGMIMIVYACTGGFDYGATMILPFLRKEEERRVVLNAVGRTWDGNQTWLVFIGGALFVIWPGVYASIFSGFYAAMLIILWSLFLRPPGFDFRSKIHSPVWRRCWDWGLFISSLFPMFAFGLALGNIMQGVPIYFDHMMLRPFYAGNFWGLINWFGIMCGITSVLMALMHGSILLRRRTTGDLSRFFKRFYFITAILFTLFFIADGFMVAFAINGYKLISSAAQPYLHPLSNVVVASRGEWIKSYYDYPWKAYAPVFAFLNIILAMFLAAYNKRGPAFWASCIAVGSVVATFGTAIFPFVVPSSLKPAESMTVFSAANGYYKLEIMLYFAFVLLVSITLYKLFAYYAVWNDKQALSVDDVRANDHEFY